MGEAIKNRYEFVILFDVENGNIVEMGNHESLLKENGLYASLYNSQFAK